MDRKQARAFESFVAESGDTLLRMAALLASDPQTAEDVYQETPQRLAARWSRVDNPKAFCRRVLHNIVIDRARAQRRRPRELELFAGHDSSDPRSGDPLAAVELRPALLAALAGTVKSTRLSTRISTGYSPAARARFRAASYCTHSGRRGIRTMALQARDLWMVA